MIKQRMLTELVALDASIDDLIEERSLLQRQLIEQDRKGEAVEPGEYGLDVVPAYAAPLSWAILYDRLPREEYNRLRDLIESEPIVRVAVTDREIEEIVCFA
jgi:hypothetical protein